MIPQIKKGDTIELDIHDLAFGAKGVARLNDFVWFVKGGIPGQKVMARVKKRKRQYGEAVVEKVLEPSPYQIDAPCPYFGVCGGCQLQHFDYAQQLDAKTRQIQEILIRLGGLEGVDVQPIIGSNDIYAYRNKMEFTFSDRRWVMHHNDPETPTDFALGLHVPKVYSKVLNIDACLLQSAMANDVFKTVHELVRQTDLPPYNLKTHKGFWRFLVMREGKNTGDLMLNFVTSGQFMDEGKRALDWVVHKLFWRHPDVTSVIQTFSNKKAQVAFGQSHRLLLGPEKITEKIGDRIFEISPDAFFQTNTKQTEVLFDTVARLADFQGHENVFDLYCGTGAIGICIASQVKRVLGIEIVESAVNDAARNAELNQLENIEFFLADMKDAMINYEAIVGKYGSPDVIIMDPPRGGTHPKSVEGVLKLAASKIVYVSCNPAILARDLAILCETDYEITAIQPVDMFPHTGHIEVVAALNRKS